MIDAASTFTLLATFRCPLPIGKRQSTSSEWKRYAEYCDQFVRQCFSVAHSIENLLVAADCQQTHLLLRSLFEKYEVDGIIIDCDQGQTDLAWVMSIVDKHCVHGETLVCDTSHAADIKTFVDQTRNEKSRSDLIVSGDNLDRSDLKGLAIAAVRSSGQVVQLAVNRLPDLDGKFQYLNGYYWFRDLGDVYSQLESGRTGELCTAVAGLISDGFRVALVPTPTTGTSLTKSIALRRGSVFCDIDGTLVAHEDIPSYRSALEVLPGSRETLNTWREHGKEIILVTARNPAEETLLRSALKDADIPYDRLIMGVPSGPRHLINDRKPSAVSVPQAVAHEIWRDEGVSHLSMGSGDEEYYLRRFPGGSYADTFLVEKDGQQFVRKRVSKSIAGDLGHGRLRDQYHTLQRFAALSRGSTPQLLGESDSSLEYYFDMEFLSTHEPLSELSQQDQEQTIQNTVELLFEDVYRPTNLQTSRSSDWFQKHLKIKIYPKTQALIGEPGLTEIIAAPELTINGVRYSGLNRVVERIVNGSNLKHLIPRSLSLVHGDLTGENILCLGDDIRLIDMDGGGETEPAELDLGKLFQSLVACYETWSVSAEPLVRESGEGFLVQNASGCLLPVVERLVREWASLSGGDAVETFRRGLFFMSLHLIRMAPFRLRVSVDQARFALISAVRWLSYCADGRDEISLPAFAVSAAE